MFDIIDMMHDVRGYVKILLKTGETMYAKTDFTFYDEDENEEETIKSIIVHPWKSRHPVCLYEDEVVSFEEVDEKDIPAVE